MDLFLIISLETVSVLPFVSGMPELVIQLVQKFVRFNVLSTLLKEIIPKKFVKG